MRKQTFLLFFIAGLLCTRAAAVTIYNEAVLGDLSNNGFAPTVLTVSPGSNLVYGTTGATTSGAVDRDYFTITVASGYHISALMELGGTQVGGSVSFLALEAGPQFTIAPTTSSATGMLGWDHYGRVSADTNILPRMSNPNSGSSGFSDLPGGQYTFWIQDYNNGTFSYAFDVQITPTPEPATYGTALAALLCGGFLTWTRSHKGIRFRKRISGSPKVTGIQKRADQEF